MWIRKWREGWKRDREEELVLVAVQEEVLRESKETSQSAKEAKEANGEKEVEVEVQGENAIQNRIGLS